MLFLSSMVSGRVSADVLGLANSFNREGERKMSEVEGLKAEIAVLRGEVEQWKVIVIDVLGKASRAQGFAEGVGEGTRMQLDALNGRVTLLESRQSMRYLSFPIGPTGPAKTTIIPLTGSPNSEEML